MKILQIMAGGAEGGAEIFFTDALKALNKAGVEQYVITRTDSCERIRQINELKNIPLKSASFSNLFRFPTTRTIKKAIRDFQPDIIQYWMGRAASYAVIGDHINIGWYGSYNKTKRFQKCDYHLAITDDARNYIISQGITEDRVFTLPIYTHEKTCPPLNRSDFNTPDNVPLLLSLARLHPVKGLDILLQAMTQIPDAYLWLAGSGPLEDELKAQATALNLNDRVRFLGWREDKEALMATADLCVFPSRNDSFGAVMTEAWSQSVPFVATKAPGPKAHVTHEKDGLLVEIDDVDGFAAAVNRVINDPELAKTLTENGRRTFEDHFTQDAYIRNAMAIYNSENLKQLALRHALMPKPIEN